jgi:hypothetical protein
MNDAVINLTLKWNNETKFTTQRTERHDTRESKEFYRRTRPVLHTMYASPYPSLPAYMDLTYHTMGAVQSEKTST